MKTKHDILIENEWQFIFGYSMGYGKNPDYDNFIIEKEEVDKLYGTPASYYYFQDGDDVLVDLDEAWESFCEHYCNENEVDLSDEEIYDKFKN